MIAGSSVSQQHGETASSLKFWCHFMTFKTIAQYERVVLLAMLHEMLSALVL
jgi:hypothetical protein